MKIRTSINVVFLFVGVTSSIIMANILFELMRDHHKEGATAITKVFLLEAAADNKNGHDESNNIIIRSAWADFVPEMRAHFSRPPKELGEISKSHLKPAGLFDAKRSYFVLYTTNALGNPVYVAKEMYTQPEDSEIGIFTMVYWRSLLLSIILAAVFAVLLVFILKAIVKPLESLKLWAKAMAEPENAPPNPIHFRYKELSDIADTISQSIEKQKDALKKEEEFLQFSSHELRTPLAVLRSNVDLLKKILPTSEQNEEKTAPKMQSALKRMDDATTTMTRLVETFLRLSRDADFEPEVTTFDLAKLVGDTLAELSYLNQIKALPIKVNTTSFALTIPFMPCQIILRNILANALEHAVEGEITITQEKSLIRVSNANKPENVSTGFGLGLHLVKKMAARYGWSLHTSQTDGLYTVEISFLKETLPKNA